MLVGPAFALAGTPWMKKIFIGGSGGLTTLLYHGFFFNGEDKSHALDRLRRQLEWLRRNYQPLTLGEFLECLASGKVPPKSLLVTADDAKLDVMDVHEEFAAFGIPLTIFVCAGWTSQASALDSDGLLACVVATLEWYAGPALDLSIGGHPLVVSRSSRETAIDQILASKSSYAPHLAGLLDQLIRAQDSTKKQRNVCSWTELQGLRDAGVQFGSHSVSHIRMAPASDVRLSFEILESKRLMERKLAHCSAFAYPFGTEDTCSPRTTALLESAGVGAAFMTNPGFITASSPALGLPRFALPERPMSDREFRGRVRGGSLTLRQLRRWLRDGKSSTRVAS